MKAVVQRVHWARVEVDNEIVGKINGGLLVYVGVSQEDSEHDVAAVARKIAGLRIFEDQQEKMNLSVQDAGGGVLAIPNFTLMADTRKGRRPSFVNAAAPDRANELYETFVACLRDEGCHVEKGVFQATMLIQSEAAGPVNVIVDSMELSVKRP